MCNFYLEKLAYANTLNISWPYQLNKPEYKKGEWYLGVNFRGVNMPKDQPHGYLSAIDDYGRLLSAIVLV